MRYAAIALCLTIASTAAGAATLDDLSWMTGHWRSEADGTASEELWMAPEGGLMLGVHRDTRPGKSSWFEFLRIEERNGEIAFVAQPGGKTPTPFPLKEIDGTRVTFENLDHDFPQRVIYWLDEESLCARAEGKVDGDERGSEWCWRRK